MSATSPSAAANSGRVHDTDWRRLHGRVLPNPLSLAQFKACVTDGTVSDAYRATDLHKIAQEMRDILREHGELREAACFPVKGKKGELGTAMAAAIRVLSDDHTYDAAPFNADASTAATTGREVTGTTSAHPRREREIGTLTTTTGCEDDMTGEGSPPSVSPEESGRLSGSASSSHTNGPRSSSGRHLPITDHIVEGLAASDLAPPSTLPARTHPTASPSLAKAGKIGSERDVNAKATSGPPSPSGSAGAAPADDTAAIPAWSLRIARNASQPHTPDPPHTTTSSSALSPAAATVRAHAYSKHADDSHNKSAPLPPGTTASAVVTGTTESLSTGITNELNALNDFGSPFFQILNVVRRFQLRYGTHQLRFDIPVQYAQAVAARRLRVFIIPFRHPNLPSRWPTAKEIVVYVNDQCVTIPWKRAWPERKEEVAKSFLPLDVTQMLLSRSGVSTTQRLQVDVFTSEYFAPALLVVAQPFSLEEVLEQTLYDVAGSSEESTVESHLLTLLARYENTLASSFAPSPSSMASNSASPAQVKLATSMNDTLRFYRSIMEEDVDDGIEVDDPIITTKCPISQLPLRIPVRGVHCRHLQCVDLAAYLMSCAKGCYWNCALCDCPLRPRDARIDTVLWAFLSQARVMADSLPHYLRLSVREASAHPSNPHHHYYWHASRPHGGDADVLVDTSSGDDEEARQEETVAAGAPIPAAPSSEVNVSPSTVPPAGHKRPRSPLTYAAPAPTEGTMDNPIEL